MILPPLTKARAIANLDIYAVRPRASEVEIDFA